MIQIENLRFSYGGNEIFSGVSHTFGPVTCITGPSGCGKTTLLRLVAGLEEPQGGKIGGAPARPAVLFQEDRLLPWLTARQNVAAVLPGADRGAAADWLRKTELADFMDVLPENLSGGQKRRVALARALCYGGDLLILDENFKGFDPALTKRMAALILAQEIPVIAAVHSPEEMALLGGDVLRLG